MEQRRLYIGGLSDSVLEKDIEKKFSEFGTVKDVELRCKENYGNRRYFAYINLQAEKNSFDNCEYRTVALDDPCLLHSLDMFRNLSL